jgi:hydrogenase expression/formation protein HypE
MSHQQLGQCPLLRAETSQAVTLAHGEGGRLSRELLEERILPLLCQHSGCRIANYRTDAAYLECDAKRLAFSTDSYVVSPLFFPGGDIGKLAVFGTCNDLSMVGAEPKWLSVSLILEEGFSLSALDRVVQSLAMAANEAKVQIATGDTKVVPKGCVDGLFINTSGIGIIGASRFGGGESLAPGNKILVTGPIGQHGLSILSVREEFGIEAEIGSDCGSLWPAVKSLLDGGVAVRAMRDATRGGVAAVLHEWARDCGHSMVVDQARVPLSMEARGLTELLGLDPLFIANEGTMLIGVEEQDVSRALKILEKVPISRNAQLLGEVQTRKIAPVAVERSLGRLIPLDELSHSLLPRIC